MKKYTWTPVCIFLWKKYHLIHKVLGSLKKAKGFYKTKIYMFVDSSDFFSKHYPANQKLLEEIKKYRIFKNISFIYRNKNFGLKKNIIDGINHLFKSYSQLIILEDDLIVSKEFLVYMNKALKFYKNNKKVFSISGFNHNSYQKFIKKKYKYSNFFSLRTSSWGWGTWRNRWKYYEKQISVEEIKKNKKNIINLLGYDTYLGLLNINLKKRDLWAANWSYAALKTKKLTSYPVLSYISNIGFDGTGEHGFSKKFLNNVNLKKKNKLVKNINCDYNLIDHNKFITEFSENFYLQLLKYYTPLKIKVFLKNLIKNFKKNLNE